MAYSLDDLKRMAVAIRDEYREGANTAYRVGTLLLALAEAGAEIDLDKLAQFFLRKDQPDQTEHLIKFLGGLQAGEFEQGSKGVGVYQDEQGNWHIETDYMDVRFKFTAHEVEIQRAYHVGGAQIKSAASMKCVKVEELDEVYRCYMNTTDDEGNVITNDWWVDDQAYVQTFNLVKQEDGKVGNHFLWRLVVAVGEDYIDLSKTVCAASSDAPKAGDDIVLFGHQDDTHPDRQVVTIDAGAGNGAPYYRQYTGINSFSLPESETQLKPGDNKLTGVVHIQDGSTGAGKLSDLPDFVQNAVKVGGENLLLNSGFTGDYETEDVTSIKELTASTEMYSRSLEHWSVENTTVQEDAEAVSGRSVTVGTIIQFVKLIQNEKYVISFKAKGEKINIACGEYRGNQTITSEYQRYVHKFTYTGDSDALILSGTATLCDVKLERGTIATDWSPSPKDNDKSTALYQSLSYIYDAIRNGSVDILGGLILASMIQLGNYRDGKMQRVTAGVSGIYNDDDDVYTWGGGSLQQAIRTVMMYKQDPTYQPTDEELREMANAVITHGGRAIFNDVILRGYIYALGGRFRGRIEALEGFFRGRVETSIDGKRIVIDPASKMLKMYTTEGRETVLMRFDADGEFEYGDIELKLYDNNGKVVRQTNIRPEAVDVVEGENGVHCTIEPCGLSVFGIGAVTDGVIPSVNVFIRNSPENGYIADVWSNCFPTKADDAVLRGIYTGDITYTFDGDTKTLARNVLMVKK